MPARTRLPLNEDQRGMASALLTPLLLGVAPIFGKLAIDGGADPFSVAALRTAAAAGLLWIVYGLFFRRYLYIYPAGLLGCVVVGAVNGIGSLFFYSGLGRLDASLVQLLNGSYLIFAVVLARLSGERLDARTLARVLMALAGLVLITGFGAQQLDWLGVGLILGNAIMFAGTVILSQYVIYEIPSPTAALYILTTMAVLVLVVWAGVGLPGGGLSLEGALPAIALLGVSTALSRLSMFASVRAFGSLRTAVIATLEIVVALVLAFAVFGDRLTLAQTAGGLLLMASLLLVRAADLRPRSLNLNLLIVRDMSGLQFQRIAFHRAFGRPEHDNEFGIMSTITTAELQAIQKMMGVDGGRVNPFPIARHGSTPDALTALLDSPPTEAPDDDRPDAP
jgi:drug/metabolite transporter (DMT)-like permease